MIDTIIMGGGPAGSTAAGLLAKAGVNVLVVESSRFPRFHIGESLLPSSLPILEKLGVGFDGREMHYKGGAEFFDERTGDYALYPFAEALPGPRRDHALQVERAAFDERLLRVAEKLGAEVHEEERANDVEVDDDGVTVKTNKGRYRARYCVDATGQDALLAKRGRTVTAYRDFGRAAAFTHFEDLGDDGVDALGKDGNIKVLMLPDGWGWLIPLTNRRLSVGLVARERSISAEALQELIDSSPLTRRVVAGARRLGTQLVGNFSYRNTAPSGPRHFCVGDSACFLDPVFSSGVALAMEGADAMSQKLVTALENGTEGRPELMEPVSSHLGRAYSSVGALVYAFYHTQMIRNLFFASKPNREIRAGLISVLGGDIWREDNAFQKMLTRSRRRNIES